MMRLLFTLFVFLLGNSAAMATIVIDVSGVPGSGTTTWTFSGSATSVQTGATIALTMDDNDSSVSQGWEVGTAFYTGSNRNIDFTVTNATFSVSPTVFNIEGVGEGGANNMFGIAVGNPAAPMGSYTFNHPTTFSSFTGTGTALVDINNFALGTTSVSNWGANSGVLDGQLPVQFNVSAVPEPSSFIFLGLVCCGGLVYRWKNTVSLFSKRLSRL